MLQADNRLGGVHDEKPKIGKDGKDQFNMYDPDGIRTELMNFHATEKPCCSDSPPMIRRSRETGIEIQPTQGANHGRARAKQEIFETLAEHSQQDFARCSFWGRLPGAEESAAR